MEFIDDWMKVRKNTGEKENNFYIEMPETFISASKIFLLASMFF